MNRGALDELACLLHREGEDIGATTEVGCTGPRDTLGRECANTTTTFTAEIAGFRFQYKQFSIDRNFSMRQIDALPSGDGLPFVLVFQCYSVNQTDSAPWHDALLALTTKLTEHMLSRREADACLHAEREADKERQRQKAVAAWLARHGGGA